ncbi:hypothetical protein HYG86_16515 [Alkalicella caledoniensis]|uniref:Uncharacterized protein n=1 Tax=Alkalicella caledoniensis TaxID=2731377 RepID=A0A7G9WC46_ALKCA|nr:hypothetical protein [Alkalicella caledoniensis]QNO16258.1 hypothetical protein HYG86_16515 [Alkalicella caledoniensis]
MKKTVIYSFAILLLSIISFLIFNYPIFTTTTGVVDVPEEQPVTSDEQILFQEGYKLLDESKYKEALDFYKSIESKITSGSLSVKTKSLILVLERLNKAQIAYQEELEILNLAKEYQEKFLHPSYNILADIYDFHNLAVEVLIEDNFDKETDLMELYYERKREFINFKEEVQGLDYPFITEDIKESFKLTIAYSLFPTEMHYKTTHLEQSITTKEIEQVETSWEEWSKNYQRVVDYYHNFDEGLYELELQVEVLKNGYFDMKNQIHILIPDIKGDISL